MSGFFPVSSDDPCPSCGAVVISLWFAGDRNYPKAGDIVLCSECGVPAQLDAKHARHRMAKEAIDKAMQDPLIRVAYESAMMMYFHHKKRA